MSSQSWILDPGSSRGQAGDGADGHGLPPSAEAQWAASADELDRLSGVREELPALVGAGVQGHADRAGLDPAMTAGPFPCGGPIWGDGSARSRASRVGRLASTVIT